MAEQKTSETQDDGTTGATPEAPTMSQSIAQSAIGLALFALLTAGLIAVTQVQTKERISEEIRQARSKALYEIAPADTHNNDLLGESFGIDSPQLGLTTVRQAFVARNDGRPVTMLLPVRAPNGYTGPIQMIVGIDVGSGELSGVRVTQHKETPGLGDKIEVRKSDWIQSFAGRSLANTSTSDWQVKKDGGEFDQLTGATITPRTIVRSVHRALLFYQAHKEQLLQQAPGSHFRPAAAASTGEQ